ncbi:extracellular solute-binding protein, family 3 [Andreprevotia lacus DSM 23236]|jgi:polar amino acid transport system substrate-binding protein|uniref:Extracellular solute-binding protein, family 3 n=1 Tax=Andreprevotia lacus DSM 23236 TaxID=1121001 RepID=A0A1W1XZU3_9NEIS|nr:transporter substrate-binding domain-containing protein [Andreprevotia lacus]SMC29433.1 extracellular solute-binding protein, family 3 [Andreprevotia lacus DSM 23236]
MTRMIASRWQPILHALLALLASGHARAADLRAYTEEFAPFNYTEQGQPRGLSVHLLDEIAKRAGLSIDTRFMPWQRAVNSNADDTNSILFTTVRTVQREALYRWVGPIDDCDVVLIKLARNRRIQIDKPADMARYTVGVPSVGADQDILHNLGYPMRTVTGVPANGSIVRMLYAGRFELVSGVLLSYAWQARQLGLPAEQLQVAWPIQRNRGCYYAFNPQVDPALFQRFDAAFKALAQEGKLKALREQIIKP